MAKQDFQEAREHAPLLTVDQARGLLGGLARSYVYAQLLDKGILRSTRVGRRRMIWRDSLEAYLAGLRDEGRSA